MKKYQSALIWVFAFLFTAGLAVYQKMTGPTYPIRSKIQLESSLIKYKLPRSGECGQDMPVKITIADTSVHGEFTYKRYKSNDEWTAVPMIRQGNELVSMIPMQPAAGKVSYKVTLLKNGQQYKLNENQDVVLRFKGSVPLIVLIFHIIAIFGAMLLSTVTCLEAIFQGKNVLRYIWLTVIFFLVGGLILGPVVQKYAFDAFWTGWPFGHDLTDNKTLIGLIFWIIALIVQYRKPGNRSWPVIAGIVFLVVFLIPHSALGSEIDYTKQTPARQSK
ncbi:MAG: hypothetical protein NTY96_03705 [Bacteroidetes bacterium]|nr:hypothetical protein [Bacteroidota bacterium]